MAKLRAQKSGLFPQAEDEPKPGEITGAALAARDGDAEALQRLSVWVMPELRRMAQLHLVTQGGLRLSPTQIARLAVREFATEENVDLQSRADFFAFAERKTQQIIDDIVDNAHRLEGTRLENGFKALFQGTAPDSHPVALCRAIREVGQASALFSRLLQLRFFLGLDSRQAAEWLAMSESELETPWEEAELLLAGLLPVFSEHLVEGDSLDSSPAPGYSENAHFSPSSVPEDHEAPPPAPSESTASLRAEVAELRTALAQAKRLIAELREQEGASFRLESPGTRDEIRGLLTPPSLEEIPLLEGRSLDELLRQFEKNYGRWLTYFGAEHDSVSLGLIRSHDPRGIQKLSEKISRQRGRERRESGAAVTSTLGEMVPTKADHGNLLLAGKTVEELFDPANRDLAVRVCARLNKYLYGK